MALGNYNKCNKRRRKQGLIGLGLVTVFVVGIAIALIVMGYDDYDYGQELKENSSLEECEIIEIDESSCDSDIKGKIIPDYILISPDKCGYNSTLSQVEGNEIECVANDDIKSMNQTYSCYVNDECDYYSFNQYDTLIDHGWNYLIAGIVVFACLAFIWILVGFLCICNTQNCGKKYNNVNVDEQ